MALTVNGERIEDASVLKERKAIRRLLLEKMPDIGAQELEQRSREWAVDNLIEATLLRQAAAKDSRPIPTEEIDAQLRALQANVQNQPGCLNAENGEQVRRQVELQLRVQRFVAQLTSHVARPRRKDIVEFYRKNREHFLAPEAVHAAHIVKNVNEQVEEATARQALESVSEALRNGSSFEQLADEFSDCPGRGGDLGFFGRGEMVSEFESVAFTLPPGEMSDIFRTPIGFHIVKVYERRAEGILPLEDVSKSIEERLFADKQQKVINQHLDSLRAKSDIAEVKSAQ
jgi:parvulin-like peptidyl-prolyl isomerase